MHGSEYLSVQLTKGARATVCTLSWCYAYKHILVGLFRQVVHLYVYVQLLCEMGGLM